MVATEARSDKSAIYKRNAIKLRSLNDRLDWLLYVLGIL